MTADIRRLDLEQIETLIDWAANESWNPGLDDPAPFQLADPNGFLGAFIGGRMVAGISVVAYDQQFGFLGLYICHPDFRGQGLGRAVWDAGMAYLGQRTIGLDGVPEQQANYRRMGFVTQYETIRMAGLLQPAPAKHCWIEPGAAIERIVDLDKSCFPSERQAFLSAWIAPPRHSMVAKVGDRVAGYMVVRDCRSGKKIGPLFAHNISIAMDMLGAAKGPVQLDVPMHQEGLLAALEGRGFAAQFKTARMYRGTPRPISHHWVFGVSTLELG